MNPVREPHILVLIFSEQIEEFTTQGFLKGAVVLSHDEVNRLNHELERVLAH